MGWMRAPKPDPIAERSRALEAELRALQAEIRDLGSQLEDPQSVPAPAPPPQYPGTAPSEAREPLFESVPGVGPEAAGATDKGVTGHFNALGVRKYDLRDAWQRFARHLRGPAANNPRLIHYLAAGSIQGLRPLRYESRVARNRVIALAVALLLVLWGLIALFRNY